eukprot:TRINITY_DN2340_c0_g1_i2.p1 TRINITY_DN2340_c0_g1~~TRINITY_DN2340_c0_g1_i2.p1  ORF type:complete len:279 (-),score=9.99 TRINITY_DN2340_c0_g1_i2:1258-2025(-)
MTAVLEPPVDRATEVFVGFITAVFFFFCYYAARVVVNSVESTQKLTVLAKHELLNVVASLIHSSLESVFVVALLYAYNFDQVLYANWVRLWVMFFIGYNIWDTISCSFYNFHIFRLVPNLIPHHALMIGAFVAVLFIRSDLMFYFVGGGLCEVHSVFLHIRNILRVIKPHFGWLRWPNEFFNALTFLTCRYSASVWLVYQGYTQREDRGWLWVFLPSILLGINTMMGYHFIRGYIRDYGKFKRNNLGDRTQRKQE